MISPIGKTNPSLRVRGLTFIEVMVTLTIFSIGIVGIFKTFIVSIDRFNYMTNRMYASVILDHRIATIEKILRTERSLPSEVQKNEILEVGGKKVVFEQDLKIAAVEDFIDTFELTLTLTWKEANDQKRLYRSAYINDIHLSYGK